MNNNKIKFISLMQDIIFKTVWQSEDKLIKDYWNRLLQYIVGFDTSNYNLMMNELPINNIESISSRVDILLESPQNPIKINIELNPINKKTTRNKNNSYLYKIAGEMYKKNSEMIYDKNIRIIQINFNGFYHKDHNYPISRYKLYDKKKRDTIKDIEIINIYLPVFKKLCYTKDNEIYKDLAMFEAQSFEEMSRYVSNDESRRKVMEKLSRIIIDKDVPTYDYGAYLKALHKEVARDARKEGRKEGIREGRKEGIQEGIQEGQNNIIVKLISSGMSKEEISQRLNIPINKINV